MGFVEDEKQLQEPILQKAVCTQVAAATVPEEWSTGLCECYREPGGWGLCCVSCFLPCVQYGVLTQNLPQDPFPMAGSFCGGAIWFGALECLAILANSNLWPGISMIPTSALLHMFMRRHIRNKYNIKGSWCSDLCTTWFCAPCALAQETRELVIRSAVNAPLPSGSAGSGAAAPPPLYMVGNMVVPLAPSGGNAFATNPLPDASAAALPAVPAAPEVMAVPATGFPVPAVPVTHVATVTLGQTDGKVEAAAK